MSNTVLVLGATGRFGRHVSRSFVERGWTLRTFGRRAPEDLSSSQHRTGSLLDAEALARAAEGVDVIVHAINPPYGRWEREARALAAAVIESARASGATIMLPGNVYGFGEAMPERLDATTPVMPSTSLGRVRADIEGALRDAADDGVRSIVLRAGDFIEGERSGNWFEDQLLKRIEANRIMYPGPLDRAHAWAWLPDLARAAVDLADRRDALQPFEDVPFPGWTLSGQELVDTLGGLLGQSLTIDRMPWSLLRIAAPFSKDLAGVLSMRYLWSRAHRLEGSQFAARLPDFAHTSPQEGLAIALERLGLPMDHRARGAA